MPSSLRAHRSIHVLHKHVFAVCNKTFSYQSVLKIHQYVHLKSKRHRCFHGNCNKTYHWVQDLNQHILCHFVKKWQCPDCELYFYKKHLLKCHNYKHKDIYICQKCGYRGKWPTPFQQHINR